jgi:hypothetical protein
MAKEEKDNTNKCSISGSEISDQPRPACPGTSGYEIRVKDHLETYWFEWFEGWSIANLENGEVLIASDKVDQSKLHGALNKIRDLNLTLLSVACLPRDV